MGFFPLLPHFPVRVVPLYPFFLLTLSIEWVDNAGMGIPMPRKPGDEPTMVHFYGLAPGDAWTPDYPPRVDVWMIVDQISDDTWTANQEGYYAELNRIGSQWLTRLAWLDPSSELFDGVTPPDEVVAENSYTIPTGRRLFGGSSEVMFVPVENLIAELAGAITGPKSFYEPMPKATPHRSYRYARHYDGTRIYVRSE